MTGLVLLGAGITTATDTASAVQGTGPDKVFVCKYVGQPGVDERLQTGQNPIDVSVNAIKDWPVAIGSYFADAQERSYVLAFDTGQADPDVNQCPAGDVPTQPNPIVTTRTADATSCTEYSVRTITTTTPYVLKDREWVLGEPVVTTGEWVNSTPTAEQIKAAGLDCSVQPNPVVTTRTEDATSCTEYSVRTITTTTPYVLKDREWVLGEPVVTTGEWVNSTPTAGQIKAAGLDCSVPVTTPTTPVSVLGTSATAVPTKSPVTVLGTSATANPLPAAAHAGLADTSGQVIVGSLAAFAALLLLGSAFLLRRRHGVV